jgi:hypothetical protein
LLDIRLNPPSPATQEVLAPQVPSLQDFVNHNNNNNFTSFGDNGSHSSSPLIDHDERARNEHSHPSTHLPGALEPNILQDVPVDEDDDTEPEVVDQPELPPHICEYCHKRFAKRNKLKYVSLNKGRFEDIDCL